MEYYSFLVQWFVFVSRNLDSRVRSSRDAHEWLAEYARKLREIWNKPLLTHAIRDRDETATLGVGVHVAFQPLSENNNNNSN